MTKKEGEQRGKEREREKKKNQRPLFRFGIEISFLFWGGERGEMRKNRKEKEEEEAKEGETLSSRGAICSLGGSCFFNV